MHPTETLPPLRPPAPPQELQLATAALAGLLLLSGVMVVAAVTGIEPHPPHDKIPFVSVDAALALMSWLLLRSGHAAGAWLALLTALAYLPSVGPHKLWTEVHAQALAPVIVVGSAAVLVLALCALRLLRRRPACAQ